MSTPIRLHPLILTAVIALIGTSATARTPDSRPASSGQSDTPGAQDKYVLSGPHTHENLTLYLVHGQDQLPGRNFVTLEEALAENKARVHETGNVSELAIENLTEDEEIFIQAGDIVCGGKQDRVLGQDQIVSPKSGKIPLQSFCVEAGRWQGRGAEPVAYFASSRNLASSNALKLAIRKERDQRRVWQNVEVTQKKLSRNVGTPVNSPVSQNSLELTLQNKDLQEKKIPYTGELSGAVKDKVDVVGLVVILNRKIYSADVYASPRLFRKLWPKLLDAGATEAIANLNERYALHKPSEEAIEEFLTTNAESSGTTEVLPHYRIIEKNTKDKVIFELEDKESPGRPIHCSIVPTGG